MGQDRSIYTLSLSNASLTGLDGCGADIAGVDGVAGGGGGEAEVIVL